MEFIRRVDRREAYYAKAAKSIAAEPYEYRRRFIAGCAWLDRWDAMWRAKRGAAIVEDVIRRLAVALTP